MKKIKVVGQVFVKSQKTGEEFLLFEERFEAEDMSFGALRKLEDLLLNSGLLNFHKKDNYNYEPKYFLGTRYYSNGLTICTVNIDDPKRKEEEINNLPEFVVEGKKTGLVYYAILFRPGYVINCGKKHTNLFGVDMDQYVRSIGKKNFKSCSKASECVKLFDDYGKVVKFLDNHKEELHYMANEYGYIFFIEDASEKSREYMNAVSTYLTKKKKEKILETKGMMEELLEEINQEEPEVPDNADIPEIVNADNMMVEANRRMKGMKMVDYVFKKPKAGIMYDIMEGYTYYDEASKAVQALEENVIIEPANGGLIRKF